MAAFAAFGAAVWGICASFGIVPSLGKTLFAQGAPAFGWAFFDMIFPMELMGSYLVTLLAAKFAVWAAGLVVSVVRQATSTL